MFLFVKHYFVFQLNLFDIYFVKVKVMCGTPEFLAPEILNFDPISFATGCYLFLY